MAEECPICLELKKDGEEEHLFQCRHTICQDCASNLFKHQCMSSCPVCRADPHPSNQFSVQVVCGERQLFITDTGHYRVLDGDSIRVGAVDDITDLLPELCGAVVVGVRFVEASVAYLVHGPPSKGLLDILSKVPAASFTDRAGRHARIQLSREPDLYAELINGFALPAVEFVRLITFPVRLVEVEVSEDEGERDGDEDNGEGEDSEVEDNMDTDDYEGDVDDDDMETSY